MEPLRASFLSPPARARHRRDQRVLGAIAVLRADNRRCGSPTARAAISRVAQDPDAIAFVDPSPTIPARGWCCALVPGAAVGRPVGIAAVGSAKRVGRGVTRGIGRQAGKSQVMASRPRSEGRPRIRRRPATIQFPQTVAQKWFATLQPELERTRSRVPPGPSQKHQGPGCGDRQDKTKGGVWHGHIARARPSPDRAERGRTPFRAG